MISVRILSEKIILDKQVQIFVYLMPMFTDVVLRNRVRDLRNRLRLRQADLAEGVGVTRQTILAIEKGRLNPSIALCLRICRILGEPVDYVFYLDRRPKPVEMKAHAEAHGHPGDEPQPPPEPHAIFDFV